MEIRSVRAILFHMGRRTDGHTGRHDGLNRLF